MKLRNELIGNAADFVFDLYKSSFTSHFLYHNLNHFNETVEMCEKMCRWYKLDEKDREHILLAAWFHDTGYSVSYEDHESQSARIAEDFLKERNYPEEDTREVINLILSTNVNHSGFSLKEEILHDADYINIGKKRFFERGDALRIEWEQCWGKKYGNTEWANLQLNFLLDNIFYTEYCLSRFSEQRNKNIQIQREKLNAITESKEKSKAKTENKKKLKSEQEALPKRGVETMFRSIYRNHISLSSIADSKANMMISINTIIMSVIISLVGSGLIILSDKQLAHYKFIIPIGILLFTCLASVVFAIVSARPNVTEKSTDPKDIKEKKSSLLFFGNFSSMPLNSFLTEVNSLMENKELLYDNMTIDIYYLGKVLTRKYQLLRISYSIFLVGIILCVLSFAIVTATSYAR